MIRTARGPVLCALAVVLAAGCSPAGSAPPAAASPQPAASPRPGFDSPPGAGPEPEFVQGEANFVTEDGNIGCSLIADVGARCDIDRISYTPPPRPADCDGQWGRSASVGASGAASLQCVTDTAFGGQRVLRDVSAIAVDAYLCTFRTSTLTCENRETGHGFALSGSNYAVY